MATLVFVLAAVAFLFFILFLYKNVEVRFLEGVEERLSQKIVALSNDLERCRKEKDNAWALLAQKRGGRILEGLKLITEHIRVSVESFTKTSFFENGPVKLYFWPNFKNWVLSAIPDTIPAFTTTLSSFTLTKNMYEKDILAELGNPTPFTVSEFAAILKGLLSKQPQGEAGDLLINDGYANIFYVKLDDGRTVAVSVFWYTVDLRWRCGADVLGSDGWCEGGRVFVRS